MVLAFTCFSCSTSRIKEGATRVAHAKHIGTIGILVEQPKARLNDWLQEVREQLRTAIVAKG
jgi:hypothetical protein